MNELEMLQAALQRNQQAASDIEGYREDEARAQSYRDRFMPQAGQGYIPLTSVIGKIVGDKRARDIEATTRPGLERARAAKAESGSELGAHKLRMAYEKAQRDERKLQEYEEQGDYNRRQRYGDRETYVNSATGEERTVFADRDGRLYFQGSGDPVGEGWVSKERVYGRGGSGFRGKSFGEKFKDTMTGESNAVRKQVRLNNEFKPWYAQPTNLPTEFMNSIATGASRSDLMKYVDQETDANVKEAMRWWADFRMNYDLMKRYELFGATLTNNEMRSWKEASNMVLGSSPEEVEARLGRLIGDVQTDFSNKLNSQYQGTDVDSNRRFLRELGQQNDIWDKNNERFDWDYQSTEDYGIEIGFEEDGYRYLGGDPSNEDAWEAITNE